MKSDSEIRYVHSVKQFVYERDREIEKERRMNKEDR